MKKRLFFDMDNVLVDFQSGLDKIDEETKQQYRAKSPDEKDRMDEIPGLFSLMEPMPGAIEAVYKLAEVYDVFILSTAPWKNPSAWSDKVEWVKKYFDDSNSPPDGNPFYKRMIITHRKDLVEGDYLIDDCGKNGTSEFKGEWIQFGSERFPDWKTVTEYLLGKKNKGSSQSRVRQLLHNRNAYSWTALMLLVLFELFAFGGIHCNWCIWGPWTLLTSLLVISIGIIGKYLNHKFNLRSVILTKLLANAIVPQRLGAIYLLMFVIHIGWLTNAVMSLFIPSNPTDVLVAIGICVAGLITLICFFPDGMANKEKAKVVFISGMSKVGIKEADFKCDIGNGDVKVSLISLFNQEPLANFFQLIFKNGQIKQKDFSKMLILSTDAYYKEKFFKNAAIDITRIVNEGLIAKEGDVPFLDAKRIKKYNETYVYYVSPYYNVDIQESESEIEDILRSIIKITLLQEFKEHKAFLKHLSIDFTLPCNYDDFDECFRILSDAIKNEDNNEQRLFFNLTPGTGIVGALMTLFSIDKDRELFFYAQMTSKLLKPVDKTRLPLENLLSQALEKFHGQDK